MKGFIVAGGSVYDEFILNYQKKERYQVAFAVDKGLAFFTRTKQMPDYIVGDFDSVEEEDLSPFLNDSSMGTAWSPKPEILRLNRSKNDTDTQHAMKMALDLGLTEIHVFGATGTRLDHVLGNIQMLGIALRESVDCFLLDPWNRIRLVDKKATIKKENQFGTYVSVVPYTSELKGLTIAGVRYPLENHHMSSFYREGREFRGGISNEITADVAEIQVKEGVFILIESREEGIHES